jgi:hypothetical protein
MCTIHQSEASVNSGALKVLSGAQGHETPQAERELTIREHLLDSEELRAKKIKPELFRRQVVSSTELDVAQRQHGQQGVYSSIKPCKRDAQTFVSLDEHGEHRSLVAHEAAAEKSLALGFRPRHRAAFWMHQLRSHTVPSNLQNIKKKI